MSAVHFDPIATDDERRQGLYSGELFVYSPKPSTLELCRFARELTEAAFSGLDPRRAQHALKVEEFAAILGRLKPSFIHHPTCKELIPQILREFDCDPSLVYFDVPRLRSSTSDGYLTAGIAYAWHPHRDTWYSAPACQINWWLPVYEIDSGNAMAFHTQYFGRAVANDSRNYDYAEWNRSFRFGAEQHQGQDPRPLPRATESLALEPQVRLLPPVGGAILFSGAQLHSSVPNRTGVTRFSIDFRTIHVGDAAAHRGAPRVDEECTSTTMGDYVRCTDYTNVPEAIIRAHDLPRV